MKQNTMTWIQNIGFRQQLVLTISIGIIVLAVLSSLALSELSTREVRKRLIDTGHQTTETLAAQSTLALLYQSADNARDFAEAMLAYPDVIGIGIFDLQQQALLILGDKTKISGGFVLPPVQAEIMSETSDAWHFIGPVYANKPSPQETYSPFDNQPISPEMLGYVHVIMGKQTLKQLSKNIYITNLSVSGVLAIILLFVLSHMTARITKPLKRLSIIMLRAEQGEKKLRADVSGTREIVEMGTAFNTMMRVIEQREQQLNQARDGLEHRVQERTTELAHSNQELQQEIAERKLIERQLINAKEVALKASHAKSVFLSNMSHELRTPLNAIIGYSELLMEELADHNLDELIPDLHKINTAGLHLLSLISQILDLARIESGRTEINLSQMTINTVLDESLSLIYPLAEKRGISIVDNLAALPEIKVESDEIRLKEIMLNLLSNAVKYNASNGNIRLFVESLENSVIIHVIDTGAGLTESQINELFEPFNRLNAGDDIEGTGIGLTISKHLIEMMHGTIGIKSVVGKGCDFWITVPKSAKVKLLQDQS